MRCEMKADPAVYEVGLTCDGLSLAIKNVRDWIFLGLQDGRQIEFGDVLLLRDSKENSKPYKLSRTFRLAVARVTGVKVGTVDIESPMREGVSLVTFEVEKVIEGKPDFEAIRKDREETEAWAARRKSCGRGVGLNAKPGGHPAPRAASPPEVEVKPASERPDLKANA